jgi:DNA polymerase III delta prime subunit
LNNSEKKKLKIENFRNERKEEEKNLENFVKLNKNHPFLKIKDKSTKMDGFEENEIWGFGVPIHIKEIPEKTLTTPHEEMEENEDTLDLEISFEKKFEMKVPKKEKLQKKEKKENLNPKEEISTFIKVLNKEMKSTIDIEFMFKFYENCEKEKNQLWSQSFQLEKEEYCGIQCSLDGVERYLEKWSGSKNEESDVEEFYSKESKENILAITGESSTGKTSCVYSIAKKFGFKIFEINSSFDRSYKSLVNEIGEITQSHSIDCVKGRMKLVILIDDVDMEDISMSTIKKLAAITKQPIIITSSNFSKEKFGEEIQIVELKKQTSSYKIALIHSIALSKGFLFSLVELKNLLEYFRGDIRKILMNLQFWCDYENILEIVTELKENISFNNQINFDSIELLSSNDSLKRKTEDDEEEFSNENIQLSSGNWISLPKDHKKDENLKRILKKTTNPNQCPSSNHFGDLGDFIFSINNIERTKKSTGRRRRFHYLEELITFQEIMYLQDFYKY